MTIDTESVRWASSLEVDPQNGLNNKLDPPVEFKTSGEKRNQPIPRQWMNHQFDAIYNALVDTQAQLDAIVGGSSQPTLEAIYPVDSLYLSFGATTPAAALGFGTWTQIKGKFLVGVDDTDSDFNVSGETGGAKSHTHADSFVSGSHAITVGELPATSPVSLTVTTAGSGATDAGTTNPLAGDAETSTSSISNINWAGNDEAHSHTLTGGVQSSSNVPPYMAVYMYRRIS
tara:strand:- start:4443 stop:5132 length:690 start_codon:yes stop_codon:yes gene_type:complete